MTEEVMTIDELDRLVKQNELNFTQIRNELERIRKTLKENEVEERQEEIKNELQAK